MSEDSQDDAPSGRGSTLDKYVVQVSLGTLWGAMAGIAVFVFWALSHFATAENLAKAETRLDAENKAIAAEIKAISTAFAELRGQVSGRLKQ